MIIWLTGAFLVALAGFLGFFLGGVRTSLGLVGTVVAAFLAKTVGGWLAAVVPMVGFRNPIWQFYLPPLIGFVVVSLVFMGLGFGIHHIIQKHFRNNTDEYTYARWFRLNRHTGAAVGASLGAIWLILVGLVAYVPGYLSTQLADDEEGSSALRFVNRFTHGMSDTGLTRIVERFQPATPRHYLAADILGLVYNNPSLHSRLASYPPFLGLAEKPEVAELARDPEVNTLLQSRAGLAQILQHEKIRAVADNHELVQELLALDFRDLDAYLRSGVSDKYKDERILGRWKLNVRRSIAEMKLVSSEQLPPVEFNLLRRALNVYLDEMVVGFTTDNRALLKVKAKDEAKLMQVIGRAAPAPAAPPPPADPYAAPPPAVGTGPGLSPRSIASRAIPQQPARFGSSDVNDRYGLGGGGLADRYGGVGGGGASAVATPLASTAPTVVPRAPVKPSTTSVLAPLMSTTDGSWSKDGESYRMQFPQENGSLTLAVRVKEHQLIASSGGRTLVFDRL